MCKEECCCECGFEMEEEIEEELSMEEMIEGTIEEIQEGGCVFCNLETLYEVAYARGRRDVADLFKMVSQDILDGEI